MRVVIGLLIAIGIIYLAIQSSDSGTALAGLMLNEGGTSLLKLLLGLAIVSGVIYIAFRDWRRSVKAVFFILVIDGALRKWLLPQASELIYFLKDFVLLGAYLRYFLFDDLSERFPIRNNLLNAAILVAGGWCIFQAFNPKLGSPIVGLLGVKSYLFYIPLIWMLPRLFRSEDELYRFIRNHLFLLIPIGILGIIQFSSPIDHPINQYIPGRDEPIATFGFAGTRNVRITSTFSYLNSYQGYLTACFGLLIPLLNYPQSRFWRNVTLCELFLIVLNIFMTGSRTPALAALLFTIGYFSFRILQQPSISFALLGRFLSYGLIALSVLTLAFRNVIIAFWRRLTDNQDLAERVIGGFSGPFRFADYTQLDGYGTGATHAGAGALRGIFGLSPGQPLPMEVEIEMGRVALELGPIGFILWYGLRIAIILSLWLTYSRLQSPFLRDLALAGFLIQSIMFIGHMVFHNTFPLYYWFYTGFIYLLPWLERVKAWQREQQWRQYYASTSASLPDASNG